MNEWKYGKIVYSYDTQREVQSVAKRTNTLYTHIETYKTYKEIYVRFRFSDGMNCFIAKTASQKCDFLMRKREGEIFIIPQHKIEYVEVMSENKTIERTTNIDNFSNGYQNGYTKGEFEFWGNYPKDEENDHS